MLFDDSINKSGLIDINTDVFFISEGPFAWFFRNCDNSAMYYVLLNQSFFSKLNQYSGFQNDVEEKNRTKVIEKNSKNKVK